MRAYVGSCRQTPGLVLYLTVYMPVCKTRVCYSTKDVRSLAAAPSDELLGAVSSLLTQYHAPKFSAE